MGKRKNFLCHKSFIEYWIMIMVKLKSEKRITIIQITNEILIMSSSVHSGDSYA